MRPHYPAAPPPRTRSSALRKLWEAEPLAPYTRAIRHFILKRPHLANTARRALWELNRGPRVGNVAMFHTGRCGSTVLGDLINQRSDVDWSGEVYANFTRKYAGIPWVRSDPMRLIEIRMAVDRVAYYGVETKALPNQHLRFIGMTLAEYVSALEGLGFTHFIVLRRRNYLRQAVSVAIGKVRGRWHTATGFDGGIAVRIDPDRLGRGGVPLLTRFAELDAHYRELDTLLRGKKLLELTYEDHLEADPTVAAELVRGSLGLPAHPVVVRIARSNPEPLARLVSNLPEIRDVLRPTPYAWMVDG